MHMRSPWLLTLLLVAVSASAVAQHAHTTAPNRVDIHASFQADVPLSREMAAIRTTFAAQLPAIRTGRLDAAGYAALGKEVEARVATIVRECRLPTDADTVLHGYIGRMLAAAARMRQPDLGPAAHRAAALEVIAAYNEYGGRFRDAAWKTLAP